jgi:hypothetical protein
MKKYTEITNYSPSALLEELSESINSGKTNITCVDKEKRRMSCIHKMNFKDVVESVFDESSRFDFYYEETVDVENSDDETKDEQPI